MSKPQNVWPCRKTVKGGARTAAPLYYRRQHPPCSDTPAIGGQFGKKEETVQRKAYNEAKNTQNARGKKLMGREALAGKKEGCPHSSFEKRDGKRNWRIWTALIFSKAREIVHSWECDTRSVFSLVAVTVSLSSRCLMNTQNHPCSLQSSHSSVPYKGMFPSSSIKKCVPCLYSFLLWPYARRPRSPSRHGFASRDFSLGLTVARSAAHHGESPPLTCTEICAALPPHVGMLLFAASIFWTRLCGRVLFSGSSSAFHNPCFQSWWLLWSRII